jgi:hypothetical protein
MSDRAYAWVLVGAWLGFFWLTVAALFVGTYMVILLGCGLLALVTLLMGIELLRQA